MNSNFTRKELIQRYENIIKRWDNDPNQTLKRLFPDKYRDICAKLQGLRNGAEYRVVDLTKEYISAGGALICGAQKLSGDKVNVHSKTKRYQDGLSDFINNFDKDGLISNMYFKWGKHADKRAKDVLNGYILEERKYSYLIQTNRYITEINKNIYSELLNEYKK